MRSSSRTLLDSATFQCDRTAKSWCLNRIRSLRNRVACAIVRNRVGGFFGVRLRELQDRLAEKDPDPFNGHKVALYS